MEFAIIETGGKQYKVAEGQKIKIGKIKAEAGHDFTFDKVLLEGSKSGEAKIGAPYVSGAKVEGKVLKQSKEGKKIVFRYHSKTRYRKKKGHRQEYTEVEITKIA